MTKQEITKIYDLLNQIFKGQEVTLAGSAALIMQNFLKRNAADIDVIITALSNESYHRAYEVLNALSIVNPSKHISGGMQAFTLNVDNKTYAIDVWLLRSQVYPSFEQDGVNVQYPDCILKEKMRMGRSKDYEDLLYMLQTRKEDTLKLLNDIVNRQL